MIYFIPWGDMNAASSRLRVFKIQPHIPNSSLTLPDEFREGDILIVQKKVVPHIIKRAKLQGAKVIYDIDDNYLADPAVRQCIQNADLVTVGSSYLKELLPDSIVIDDCLDWDGTEKQDYTEKGLVGWHGYGNSKYLFNIADTLEKRGYKIRAIVNDNFAEDYERFDRKTWNLGTIDNHLAECDFTTFYLPDDEFAQAKGMNKLIKSWAIGQPAFVSPMPEYERVMDEAGVTGFIVTDWKKHDFSKKWEKKMRDYALRFSPEEMSKQWLSAISKL
jgi:hypothetical protein